MQLPAYDAYINHGSIQCVEHTVHHLHNKTVAIVIIL